MSVWNLRLALVFTGVLKEGRPYDFSIQEVLFDHDRVDDLGVSKCQKSEASRPSGGAISHDSTFGHFTKLGEILVERLCMSKVRTTSDVYSEVRCTASMHTICSFPIQPTDEHFSVRATC